MGILKLVSFLFMAQSWAAPPINLSDVGEKEQETLKKIQNTKNLKQSDLTYTEDHNQFNLKVSKDAGRISYEVKGRSLPDREGRYLFRLHEGEFVKKIKDSKSGRWVMVQTFEKVSRRAWVPNAAVRFPQAKVPVAPAPAPTAPVDVGKPPQE